MEIFYRIKLITTRLTGRDTATKYLLNAAESGNLRAVKSCIAAGMVESPFFSATRPLILAAQNGHIDIARYLLAHYSFTGEHIAIWRAIGFAAKNGHIDIVTALLEIIDTTMLDQHRILWQRAAYLAIQEKHSACAIAILSVFTHIQPDDLAPFLPIILRSGLASVLDYLLKKSVTHLSTYQNVPLTFFAVASANQETLERWLYSTSSAAVIDHHGSTPLMLASTIGNLDMVTCLLQHDTSQLNAENTDRQSALLLAAVNGHHAVVEVLLDAGANLHLRSQEPSVLYPNNSIVYHTVVAQQAGTLRLLLKMGINPNTHDAGEKPLLYIAVEQGCIPTIKTLLAFNATPNTAQYCGKSLYTLAQEKNRPDILSLLAGCDAEEEYRQRPAILTRYTLFHQEQYDIKKIEEPKQTSKDIRLHNRHFNQLACGR